VVQSGVVFAHAQRRQVRPPERQPSGGRGPPREVACQDEPHQRESRAGRPDRARDAEKRRFLELADRLATSQDEKERAKLKDELARMTFGD